MSCSTCANNKTGVPKGCKSNGNCASGGCDQMTVFDWLSDIALPSGKSMFDVIEVTFKNGRKSFYRNEKNIRLYKGDAVAIESSPGYDVGIVTLTGELVKHQMNRKGVKVNPHELRKIYRQATDLDLEKWKKARAKEYDTMHEAREMAIKLNLNMKIGDVEYQGDGLKATFYYTADQRVDFRELIKVMGEKFRIKIEMRQIGARQEAGRLGGIGVCGRELCCSTWLTDFRSVSTSAARYQQLSLNPQKLAGQCGKLKCCLNYELDQYAEVLKSFPNVQKPLDTFKGSAIHIKTDVFKHLMWFLVQGEKGSNIICLTVEKVKEIQSLNKKGKKVSDIISYVDVPEAKPELDYANVDDQDDLSRFDDKFKKKKRRTTKKRNSGQSSRNSNTTDTSKNVSGNNRRYKGKRQRPKGGESGKSQGSGGNNSKKS